ncbi:MAG: tRNA (guanosine(46)-N7)-methyltransferase TrmB [Bacteroidales bacterium]|nr:tRNA (guanosine(46)-N7)-methyltransferase TrmB [Bacteroidales bacterium]MCF8403658.1 tRNA (guanosine(46)-N7)-methyltransferase TrmB [Bacteroidales bacterium]
MGKNKLAHFEENKSFPHFFQPSYEELVKGFIWKGNWRSGFFKNNNALVIEVGCGKGEYTVGLAKKYPDKNFIGIDIKGARMWRGARTAIDENLKNVAFIRLKIELLMFCFSNCEVDEIWITFPDPQPRKKEIRKRLTSPRFLEIYHNILNPPGHVHLKTDNLDFYSYSLEQVKSNRFKLIYHTNDLYHSDFSGDAPIIQTHYEKIFLNEGIPIKYIQFSMKQAAINTSEPTEGSFFQKVYEVARMIPYGRVTSYGSIAAFLGSKGSARMVGWAMNASHSALDSIPAHRVVNRNGMLTGKHHFGGPDIMKQLLESEGINILDNKIIDFPKYFWDPMTEL